MVTEMAVMQGAYEGRPYAVDMPVMDDCGALSSPGGWLATSLARMAIRLLLLLLAELFHCLQHGASRSSTSSIWSNSFLLNTRATAIFNGLAAQRNLYKSRGLSRPALPHRMLEFGLLEKATLELRSASTAVSGAAAAESSFIPEPTPAINNSLLLRGEDLDARRGHLALELDPPRVLAFQMISLTPAIGTTSELAPT